MEAPGVAVVRGERYAAGGGAVLTAPGPVRTPEDRGERYAAGGGAVLTAPGPVGMPVVRSR